MSRPTLTLFFLLRHRLPGHALRADTSVFFARILFGNESSSQFAYKVIINQIVGTFNLEPLFYTKKIVFSAPKVKHFVNLPDFLVLIFFRGKGSLLWRKEPSQSNPYGFDSAPGGRLLAARPTFPYQQKRLPPRGSCRRRRLRELHAKTRPEA